MRRYHRLLAIEDTDEVHSTGEPVEQVVIESARATVSPHFRLEGSPGADRT
jgi:hypothetical protein